MCLFNGHQQAIECDTVARTYRGKCVVCSKLISSGSLPTPVYTSPAYPMMWPPLDNADLDGILSSLAQKKSEDAVVVEMLTAWERADDTVE